jgi:hypothetical protein
MGGCDSLLLYKIIDGIILFLQSYPTNQAPLQAYNLQQLGISAKGRPIFTLACCKAVTRVIL